MYTCLSSHSIIWVDKLEESKKHSLFVNFHEFDVVSHSPADSVPVRSNHLLWHEWYSSTQKYCLMVLLLCRNGFFFFFKKCGFNWKYTILKYTTLFTNFHHRALCEPETLLLHYQTSLLVCLYIARSNNTTRVGPYT